MEIELIYLLVALTAIVCVFSFFMYKIVIFVLLRKVVTYIMEPIGENKYHVLAKIKKRIGTEKIKYDNAIYPLDTEMSITDTNNSELLFFKHGNAKPLTFFAGQRGNAKLLKTFTQTKVWQGIFGTGGGDSTLLILMILVGVSLIMTAFLLYTNNQLNGQVQLLQKQLTLYYNATKPGGIIIGK